MGGMHGLDVIVRFTDNINANLEWKKWLSQNISENNQVFILHATQIDRVAELKSKCRKLTLIEDLNLYISDWICKEKNILVIDAGIILTPGWIEKLGYLMRRRPDLGTLSPSFTDDNRLPYDIHGLENYIEVENQRVECVYINGSSVTPFFSTLKFSDFTVAGLSAIFDKISQLGYQHAVTDDVAAYSSKLSIFNDLRIDARKNLALQQALRNGRRNLLYVVQADFREDASNNIGGTQLHVKDLVFSGRNIYNIFVAARNGGLIQVTAYLPDERITFQYYSGHPSHYPAQRSDKEAEIFKNILAGFRIHLVHVHHTYSLSNEIYRIADSMGIPIILTLHDFYYLCPTIKMFSYESSCCIGKDNSELCKICLNKMIGIDPDINYIEEWRLQNKQLFSVCSQLIVPSQNAKHVFQTYLPETVTKIHVIEHGYDAVFTEKKILNSEVLLYEDFSYNIEQVDGNSGYCIAVEGWACLYGKDNTSARIYLEAVDSCGNRILIPTYKYERADVARGDRRYLKTGFQGYLPRKKLADGSIMLRPIILDDNVFYSCDRFEQVCYQSDQSDLLNVAFIGGLSAAKGSKEIYKIITQGPKDVNWFIFGGIDDKQLVNLKRKNLTKTGFYQRDELQSYLDLHGIDVICILSLWPETFCYTLSEAIAYRRPVIVTDIGALGERTKEMDCGWTVPLDHIDLHVLEIIKQIKNKGMELQEKNEIVSQMTWKSLNEMNAQYQELYSQWINLTENTADYDSHLFYSAWLRAQQCIANSVGMDTNQIDSSNYITLLETEIRNIKDSKSYHLARVISKMWNKLKIKRG